MAEMLVDSNRRQVCKKHITENKRYKYKKYKIQKPKMTDLGDTLSIPPEDPYELPVKLSLGRSPGQPGPLSGYLLGGYEK